MSYLCSRALVEAFSAATSSDGAPYALSSSSPTPQAFLSPDKMTEFSRPSRSGMTFGPLTEDLGEALLTWFLADSRVRTYQLPGMEPESTVSDQAFGEKWHESSVRYDRDSSSWRTHRSLFEEDLPWSSVTLPNWGMTLDGVLWEPPTSGRPISGIASGLLPTPTTVDTGSLFNKSDSPGAKIRPTLGAMAKFNLWPTPVRRDYRAPGRSRLERTGSKAGEGLPQIVGGQLNPTWVEWLMNWPMGWTSLEAITHEHFKHWQESGAAYLRGDRVQELWFDQDPSETPQGSESAEQCSREYRDSLSDLPQERAFERRDMGSWIGCSSNLRDMQRTISANKESSERSCALRGSEMPERDWKARGVKEMVSKTVTGMNSRVDRIKALGNGQVPRVAAAAFSYLATRWI
ncbi:hypothetical protein Q057_04732 [Pseudomonas aeruginosa BL03]|nr:hypothetical protein Q057_04732 [Pseudomonas aeruginosa BL03]